MNQPNLNSISFLRNTKTFHFFDESGLDCNHCLHSAVECEQRPNHRHRPDHLGGADELGTDPDHGSRGGHRHPHLHSHTGKSSRCEKGFAGGIAGSAGGSHLTRVEKYKRRDHLQIFE